MARPADGGPGADDGRIRLDRWLWHARFFRSRALAAAAIAAGRIRVNGNPAGKAGRSIGPGDTLTFVQAGQVRVVRMLAPGTRRGPAPEAQTLYADLSAPPAAPLE